MPVTVTKTNNNAGIASYGQVVLGESFSMSTCPLSAHIRGGCTVTQGRCMGDRGVALQETGGRARRGVLCKRGVHGRRVPLLALGRQESW